MRTTLTIDPEIADRLKQEVSLGKRPLKVIVNDALRKGLDLTPVENPTPFRVKPHSSAFRAGIDPARLNQLVDEIEAAEFFSKHSTTT